MAYTDKLRVVYGDYTLGVHGEGFDYIFSYAQGGLESIVKNGYRSEERRVGKECRSRWSPYH